MDNEAFHLSMIEHALTTNPGYLKVITSEIHPDYRDDPNNPHSTLRSDMPSDALQWPETFVIHEIVSVQPHPAKEGLYRAFSAEGDFCEGRPSALWTRLLDYRKTRPVTDTE